MKVEISFDYTEMVIPPRCRKERPEEGNSTITVKIKEVKESEAPVAFRVSELYSKNRLVRFYKGKLYRQVQHRDCDPFETIDSFNWQWAIGNWSSYRYHTKAENIASIKLSSKKYLLVGKDVYELCGEPYYYGCTFGLGGNHGGTGFFIEYTEPKGRSIVHGFSPLNRATAIDGVVKIALNRGDTKSAEVICESENYVIEVLMPEACKRKYNNQKR